MNDFGINNNNNNGNNKHNKKNKNIIDKKKLKARIEHLKIEMNKYIKGQNDELIFFYSDGFDDTQNIINALDKCLNEISHNLRDTLNRFANTDEGLKIIKQNRFPKNYNNNVNNQHNNEAKSDEAKQRDILNDPIKMKAVHKILGLNSLK